MAEPIINSQSSAPTEPELRQNPHEPMGVLRKNLKPLLYLGVAGLVIAAAHVMPLPAARASSCRCC
jgi:sensor domain CHASE-containing protein